MHLILYDGVCGLCNGMVRFVIARDHRRVFRFAALQSEIAQKTLGRFGRRASDLDTFYVVEDIGSASERLHTKSRAALAVGRRLGWRWAWTRLLHFVPTVIADVVYDFIAKRRYRWFGRHETCPIPTPATREYFLDHPL